jgi:hypothetical protein
VAWPGSAPAARPAFHDKINETIPDVDICGFVGTLRVRGSQVITLSDIRVKVTGEVTQVLTTAAGKSVVIKNAGQFTSTFTETGDTLTFVDTYKGLPEKISARGKGGTVLRDAGVISFITTINLVTGEVTNDVVVKGPHRPADLLLQHPGRRSRHQQLPQPHRPMRMPMLVRSDERGQDCPRLCGRISARCSGSRSRSFRRA